MKQRKLKKRIKDRVLDKVIANAHDIAVAKEVFSMLCVMTSDNKDVIIREDPFMDKDLNNWFSFLHNNLKQLIK